MITLKQLAELSGLSIRTVGRALSGHPYVDEQKRKLVLELAAKHHYITNMAARNLRLQQKNFVGILFNNYALVSDSRQLDLLNDQLIQNGFWPLLGCFNVGENYEKMLKEWSGVAEYVVILHEVRNERMEQIIKLPQQFPMKFIFADCIQDTGDLCFTVNKAESVRRMIRHVAAMGFRHLLYCGMLPQRAKGVKLAFKDKLSMNISCIESYWEFEQGYKIGQAVMDSGADVVFFDTDRMAMGFYRFAHENNITIPDRISVVGFDDEPFTDCLNPSLSTLAHPRQQVADRILQIINSGKPPSKTPLLMEFIQRDSLKKF